MPLPCDLQTAFALAEDKSYRGALAMVQTVAKEFLVVVDDSSTTSTADIVKKTDTQHPLLEVLGNGNKQHWQALYAVLLSTTSFPLTRRQFKSQEHSTS